MFFKSLHDGGPGCLAFRPAFLQDLDCQQYHPHNEGDLLNQP